MNTKTTIPITEARKRIFDIADEVQGGQYYTFTEKGRPKAVIMSAEEFDSWQETFEVTQDIPDLGKTTSQLKRDIQSGEYKNYITLDDLLEREGWIRSGKKTNKHVISRRNKARSGKRAKTRT